MKREAPASQLQEVSQPFANAKHDSSPGCFNTEEPETGPAETCRGPTNDLAANCECGKKCPIPSISQAESAVPWYWRTSCFTSLRRTKTHPVNVVRPLGL